IKCAASCIEVSTTIYHTLIPKVAHAVRRTFNRNYVFDTQILWFLRMVLVSSTPTPNTYTKYTFLKRNWCIWCKLVNTNQSALTLPSIRRSTCFANISVLQLSISSSQNVQNSSVRNVPFFFLNHLSPSDLNSISPVLNRSTGRNNQRLNTRNVYMVT
ncbi:hypothetical protein BpHYR1_053675, partial [Brachionus plicatilis]